MNVAEIMTPRESLVTATLPGSREDVLDRLQDNEFSSVPVVNGDTGAFRGLVSRERLIAEPEEDQLALLAEDVPTVPEDAPLAELAALIVETRERRIPVVTDGEDGPRLAGLVTITDLVRAIARGDVDGEATVETLSSSRVNCVHEATPLPAAERELSYAEEAYGVVLDDAGEPAGMLTEVDLLEAARVVEGEASTGDSLADEDDDWKWEGIKAVGARYLPTRNVELPAEPVRSFATADLVTATGSLTAREAARLLVSNDIEQLPVMSGNELAGIVRDVDLLEAIDE
jgi:IMP dehydrogenase